LFSISLKSQYVYEWNDYYGGDAQDHLTSFTKTWEGNIVLVGSVKDSVDAMWLVKLSSDGIKLWSKLYTGYPLIKPIKIIETKDKNLLISGIVAENDSLPHKIWLIKINQEGEILWEKLYAGNGDAYCTDISETKDKGFILSGATAVNPHEFTDWYILKLDSLGNFLWDKSFGSPYDDKALSVTELYDSTIVAVGFISYSSGGYRRASIARFSSTGSDLWYDEFRTGSYWSRLTSVTGTTDSSFVMTAEIKNSDDIIDFDVIVIKMKPDGSTVWQDTLDEPIWEQPVCVIETFDQGYAIAYTSKDDGVFNTNIAVLKINPFGVIEWKRIFERQSDDYAAQIIETQDNGIVVATSTYSIDKAWNFGILKYKSLEQSDLVFVTPIEEVSTVFQKNIPIDACIKGYKRPIEVKIYINKQLVDVVTSFNVGNGGNCNYNLQFNLELKNGLNSIDFVVTDYKEYKFVRSRTVYYLPNATPHW